MVPLANDNRKLTSRIWREHLSTEHRIAGAASILSFFTTFWDTNKVDRRESRVLNMGIQGLSKVIGDFAPGAVKENEIKNYFGELDKF